MLFLDVVSAHLGVEVEKEFWPRGYGVIYRYGGAIAIMQVPDTHIHQPFSTAFIELGMEAFTARQRTDPGNVSWSPQEVSQDMASTWRSLPHTRFRRGSWEVGVANALPMQPGSREARTTG